MVNVKVLMFFLEFILIIKCFLCSRFVLFLEFIIVKLEDEIIELESIEFYI